MKRIFTLVVAVLCSAVLFAQTNYSQRIMSGKIDRATLQKSKIEKPNRTREGEIWISTFEEDSILSVAGQLTTEATDANWELQEISDELYVDDQYPTLNSTNPEHTTVDGNEPGCVSDSPEHWMMLNGGGWYEQGAAGQQGHGTGYDFDSYMVFSNIDLTNAQNPQIEFWEYRILFNIPPSTKATVVEVSTDGGAHWTEHVVGCESATEYGFFYRRVPIFEAAEHDNVMIRFRANRKESIISSTYQGNPTYNDGAFVVSWQVDDIAIVESNPFDLVITDVRMNQGYCDYYSNRTLFPNYTSNYYHISPMYGQVPVTEWTSESMFASFNVAVENRGYDNATPIVNIAVLSPSGDTIWYDEYASTVAITPYGRDTVDVIEHLENAINHVFFFTEEQMQNIELGEYTVIYSVKTATGEDPTPANNEASHHFYITENTYCPATPNITRTCGPNVWSDYEDGDEILVGFDLYVLPEDIIPVSVFVDTSTTAGAAIAANIYEYNPTGGTDQSGAFEITLSSGSYTIQEEDLGQWVTIPFETPLRLTDFDAESNSKSIRVGIAFYENGGSLALGASRDMPNKGWICSYNMGDGVYSINATSDANAPAIRIEPIYTASVSTIDAANISMYPNPSNGIVNFTNVENATIEVYNMMGQVVSTMSNANENASMDLSAVANGNYVVRIVKDGAVSTTKLSIVK